MLKKKSKVHLITRPRRFGKTLLMRMLSDFLDIQKESRELFEGLAVSQDFKLCSAWRNQWPVLFLTFKDVEALDFEGAYGLLEKTLADLCKEHAYLSKSNQADKDDRETFLRLKSRKGDKTEVRGALDTLMRMMHAHFEKPVILLIDEYDVPLAKAVENGYYAQMLDVLRSILGIALKTNRFLKFAVITGCLRIAKESIFTGTNNFASSSILDGRFQDFFGFTKEEVRRLLAEMDFLERESQIKDWYDGYLFGERQVYCPWDVLNYVDALQENPQAKPRSYWKNTSHNDIIRSFISRTDLSVNEKMENLLNGGSIQEKISEDLTYDMLHSSENNLWSVLCLTGYLTKAEESGDGDGIYLKIPNEEIRSIFRETVLEWFRKSMETSDRKELFQALWEGDEEKAGKWISDILFNTISYHDYRESYYHAFTAGLFSGAGYLVESNYEYGLGRPDLVVKDAKNRQVLILETKYASKESALEAECQKALEQIHVKEYAGRFLKGYTKVISYGIAFYQKQCAVKSAEK